MLDVYLPVAGMSVSVLLVLAIGAGVGLLSGMFGVGGGFLITPLLLVLGIPPEVAVATGANQATATSAASALSQWQRRNVDIKMGLILVTSGIFGAVAGVQLVVALKAIGQFDVVLSFSYVLMLGSLGMLMVREGWLAMKGAEGAREQRAHRHGWLHGLPYRMRFPASKLYTSIIPPIGIGFFVGVLSGLMGVGGGFVMVPAMVYLLKMPTRVAIGTSVFQVVFVSAMTTTLQAVTLQSVDIVLAGALILGGVLGVQVGTRLGGGLKPEQLRFLLGVIVLLVSLKIAFGLIVPPTEFYSASTGSFGAAPADAPAVEVPHNP